MTAANLSDIIRQLRGVMARQKAAPLRDVDLWQRYVRQRDEGAFETLLRKHGPMVLGVCRRILGNEQDVEDAFQATFLVLVRKAASLRSPRTLANWLHGVARRTALQARSSAARRRAKETAVLPRIMAQEDPHTELRRVLDQELGRLAQKYRLAVVLCDLEGKTRDEVARQLGWPQGTVASRLARGRSILARRLRRRGFEGVLVAAVLAEGTSPACVPPALVHATVLAASDTAARAVSAQGVLSGTALALTEGVLQSMLLTKLKIATSVFLLAGLTALGSSALISGSRATEPPETAVDEPDPQQANPDHLHERVAKLKQQVQQLQARLAQLELQTRPRHETSRTREHSLANRLKYQVPFEVGYTQTGEGGRIEIEEVWGTRPQIEAGGQYLVHGRYVLPPGQRAVLYFFETMEGKWGEDVPTLDLQYVTLDKEKGQFTLLHGMMAPGNFHLHLSAAQRYSRVFADVYFGTGDNVYRGGPEASR